MPETSHHHTGLEGTMEDLAVVENDEHYENDDAFDGREDSRPQTLEAYEIDVREKKFSLFDLNRQVIRKRMKLDPDYQRNDVWGESRRSKFIESILLNFPIPPLYFNQLKGGDFVIIDGRQRTTAVYRFFNDEMPLTGLDYLHWLNGKRFSELDMSIQARLEEASLNVNIIRPSVPMHVVHEIFNRINTGGMILTRQEVRNGIFQGKSTVLLRTLSEDKTFRGAIDDGVSNRRMKDREVVLRNLAFLLKGPKSYAGDMDDFLNQTMQSINAMDEKDINQLTKRFLKIMADTQAVFGPHNFRIPTASTRGRVNIPVMESVCYFFDSFAGSTTLKTKAPALRRAFELLLNDPVYTDSVRFSTGDKKRVNTRFDYVKRYFEEALSAD